MTTWTVWEHKLTWDRETRTWGQHDRVIATGVSQAKADSLIRKGSGDRVAVPEENRAA